MTITSSTFRNNSAFMGGGIFGTGSSSSVSSVVTSPEITNTFSSASLARLTSDSLNSVSFLWNSAVAQGGGLAYKHVYGGLSLTSSLLFQNIASGIKVSWRRALQNTGFYTNNTTQHNTTQHNTTTQHQTQVCAAGDETCAGAGGGIASVYSPLILDRCHLAGNGAFATAEFSPRGGAVFAFYDTHGTRDPGMNMKSRQGNSPYNNPQAIRTVETTFEYNAAAASSSARGGGVWINGGGNFETTNFYNNTALSSLLFGQEANGGGGLYVDRSGLSSTGTNDGAVTLQNTNFIMNTVAKGGSGGGLYARGDSLLKMDALIFEGNVATSSYSVKSAGGAMAMVSGESLRSYYTHYTHPLTTLN